MSDKTDEIPVDELPVEELPPEMMMGTMPPMAATDEIFYRSELLRATEKLLKDKFVEEKLEGFDLWPIISKTMKLTFIDEREAFTIKQLIEAEICKIIRSKPLSEQNAQFFNKIDNARIIAILNINRAKGTINRNLLNERTALISQFKQIVSTSQYQSGEKRGFFSRLFGGK